MFTLVGTQQYLYVIVIHLYIHMNQTTFKATIRSLGHSYGVTIPKAFVDQGQLEEGQQYQFTVEKVDGRDNDE